LADRSGRCRGPKDGGSDMFRLLRQRALKWQLLLVIVEFALLAGCVYAAVLLRYWGDHDTQLAFGRVLRWRARLRDGGTGLVPGAPAGRFARPAEPARRGVPAGLGGPDRALLRHPCDLSGPWRARYCAGAWLPDGGPVANELPRIRGRRPFQASRGDAGRG